MKFTAVDNPKIHEFLEEIYGLPRGNPIFPFAVSSDITAMLSEQWSGLFQRLLSEQATKSQSLLVEELQRSLQTVAQLVQFLADEKGKGDKAVQEILFANHPLFEDLKQKLRNKYRIYFTTFSELVDWLTVAKGFEQEDDIFAPDDGYHHWVREITSRNKIDIQSLKIAKDLFGDDGRLLPKISAVWNDDWVKVNRVAKKIPDSGDDDIPF